MSLNWYGHVEWESIKTVYCWYWFIISKQKIKLK